MHRRGRIGLRVPGAVSHMQDHGYELPRTPLLRCWVNKGKKEGPGQDSTSPQSALLPRARTLRLSEAAELARFQSFQYQLEGIRANAGATGEGMLHSGDGE
jgi:hypothetical protein